MRLRDLFIPSFRNRLLLFFLVIVIIPMIAVAVVLVQLLTKSDQSRADAQLSKVQNVAQNLYRQSTGQANAAGQAIVRDVALRRAIADKDPRAIQKALDKASRAAGARRVLLELNGQGAFPVGTEAGVAPARNALQYQNGKRV